MENLNSTSEKMMQFLLDNKVTDSDNIELTYFQNLKNEGYDDYEFFLNMTRDDVIDMCKECDIKKNGHIKKILNGWELLSMKKRDLDLINREIPNEIMPPRVSSLLIPNAINHKQRFFNSVVQSIWDNNTGTLNLDDLVRYTIGQRELRFSIDEEKLSVSKCMEEMRNSKDGRWINVRKFKDEAFILTAKWLPSVKQTNAFLTKKIEAMSTFKKKIEQRKLNLYKEPVVKSIDEIRYYDIVLDEISSSMVELQEIVEKLAKEIHGVSRNITEENAENINKKYESKRRKENESRNIKDKNSRNLKSVVATLTFLSFSDHDVFTQINKNDFSFRIVRNQLNENSFCKLVPRLHLPGLTKLFEEEVFEDDTVLRDIILNEMNVMNEKLSKTAKSNLKRKEREAKNKAESAKQTTLSFSGAGPSKKTTVRNVTTTLSSSRKRQLSLVETFVEKEIHSPIPTETAEPGEPVIIDISED